MANGELRKSRCRREDAIEIVRILRAAGHVAYFAGGCVRDLLLGLSPKDFDVATDAPPDRVQQIFKKTQPVGAAFGVILVRQGHSVVEVATFRADAEYHDGRRPSGVRFTTAEEDARRRDFTINGLFLDPIDNRVLDFVGGQADLATRTLRAIGAADERFKEDHLRLLRAVRFAARFGLTIEPATAEAIFAAASHLPRISPERIAGELRLMLPPPTRGSAWRLLWDFGLVHEIFRFLPSARDRVFDPVRSPLMHLSADGDAPFPLALAAAAACYRLHVSPPDEVFNPAGVRAIARALRQALRISNEEHDAVTGAIEGIGRMRVGLPTLASRKRFLARPSADLSRRLADALVAAGVESATLTAAQSQLAPLIGTDVAPPPLITGDDLTALGLSPGPAYKRILEHIYDLQLEGTVATREAALAAVQGHMNK